ncbi:hypothetical protein MT438_07425 [Staphylococcus warneri]|uniref:hypothetical protein n=1 Tax=Staphylococcus warneri TaxID=1292 RepID=UPI001FB46FAB|nr:hypothetical protein [Staphylococcus warneri]MCJ1787160.1 hypothetical protein [Staphylococcus warneri]MCJ1799457.1 hypothetical protein [Staphylococcus warneri]
MKHYLYTDKEFIYSYLSQHGKGLNLSYSQMNKNTSTESESTITDNTKSSDEINGKSSGDLGLEINAGVAKGSYTDGTNYKIKINKNSLKETLNFIDSKSEAQSELYKIELHDYLYEIFENSLEYNDKLQSFTSSSVAIAEMDKDYFNFLTRITNLYTKDNTSSFLGIEKKDKEEFKLIESQIMPLKQLSTVFNELIPGDYKILFDYEEQSLIGSLYKKDLKIPLRELKYFYTKNNLKIIGLVITNVEESLQINPHNVIESLQVDREMLQPLLQTLTDKPTYYFKPVMIYSEF